MRRLFLSIGLVIVVPFTISAATCPQITRPLGLDDRGPDVQELQQYLADNGLLEPIQVSGYFNIATQVRCKGGKAKWEQELKERVSLGS